jgi:hypothetical protein
VLAPQALQVLAEDIDMLDVGHDPAQRVHQPVALAAIETGNRSRVSGCRRNRSE